MTHIYQTRFFEEGKTRGNCLAACIASLFDLPIDHVPDFGRTGRDWTVDFLEFIQLRGFEYEGCLKYDPLLKYIGVDGYIIVNGKSPRGGGLLHSTIYKDGVLVHDPHPSNAGLIETGDCFLIEKR